MTYDNQYTAKPNSASLRSLPRLRLGHITADKRLRYASPKLPSATSFIRKTLKEFSEMPDFNTDIIGFDIAEIEKILNDLKENKTEYQSKYKALTPFEIDDRIKKEIEAAEHIVIQYSGGKDSSYSMIKILPWLDLAKTEAVYIDTGAEYPDLIVHI